jgi:membrane protein CcdC involved in cytochrome C biogenesis
MSTDQLLMIIKTVLIIIYALSRQVREQEVKKFSFIIFPILAAYEAYKLIPRTIIPLNQIVEIILIVVAGLVVGGIQSAYTRVYCKEDKVYTKGGKETLIAWISLVIFRVIVRAFFKATSSYSNDATWLLYGGVAINFGFRNLILYLKHPEIGKYIAIEESEKH